MGERSKAQESQGGLENNGKKIAYFEVILKVIQVLIIPILIWAVVIEKRLTTIETKLDLCLPSILKNNIHK